MLSRLIAFVKSRPTEVWLGLWTVIVYVLAAFGIDVAAAAATAVSAALGWIVTFVANKTPSLGPQA